MANKKLPANSGAAPPAGVSQFVQLLAMRLREAYIRERRAWETARTGKPSAYDSSPHWDGGLEPGGATGKRKQRKSIWPTLAAQLSRLDAAPEEYVQQAFRLPTGEYRSTPIQPHQLVARSTIEAYLTLYPRDMQVERFTSALKIQRESLTRKTYDYLDRPDMTDDQIRRSVLTDPTLPLSALFRYCCAVKEGLKEIADYYWCDALNQYLLNKSLYDDTWSSVLPESLRRQGEQCLQAMYTTPASMDAGDNDYGLGEEGEQL